MLRERKKIMAKELEKNYNPADIEQRTYDKWIAKKYFHAEVDRDKKPFTIVMPPPNITGQLHMGHALDETLQDILDPLQRECRDMTPFGYRAQTMLRIATEAKVVEDLRAERESAQAKILARDEVFGACLGHGRRSSVAVL